MPLKGILGGCVLVLASLLAPPVWATWVVIENTTQDWPMVEERRGSGDSRACVRVRASSTDIYGVCFAYDFQILGSMRAAAISKVGMWHYFARHFPSGEDTAVGEVELGASASFVSNATLVEAECSAAMLGFLEVGWAFDGKWTYLREVVARSVGETQPNSFGFLRFQLDGMSIGLPLATASTGTGSYPDSGADAAADAACPVKRFNVKTRAQAFGAVWADGTWPDYDAIASGTMSGSVNATFMLLEHPECP